ITTDPPPINPPPIETTTVRRKGSKPPLSLCLLVFSVTEEGSKHTTDGNPPPRPTIPLSLDFSVPSSNLLSSTAKDNRGPRSNEADQRRVTWKCLKLVLIASPGNNYVVVRVKACDECAPNFVDLLNSQQDSLLPELDSLQLLVFTTQCTETSSFCEESPTQLKERNNWTPSDDLVLIITWLNTSKDPVVSNEQKACAFWSRIAAYYAANPKVERGDKREPLQCKQRWHKLNDLVCKFCGSYAAATRHNTSGQSESDVVKLAHEIFFNNHKLKFNLHHAWEELRNDQKWCEHVLY
ncbi:unnamed protein product, partial [Brassica oleracea var. botrytis]